MYKALKHSVWIFRFVLLIFVLLVHHGVHMVQDLYAGYVVS